MQIPAVAGTGGLLPVEMFNIRHSFDSTRIIHTDAVSAEKLKKLASNSPTSSSTKWAPLACVYIFTDEFLSLFCMC